VLVGLEGMGYESVAQVLGVPIGTVRSRLSRGREKTPRIDGERQRTAAAERPDEYRRRADATADRFSKRGCLRETLQNRNSLARRSRGTASCDPPEQTLLPSTAAIFDVLRSVTTASIARSAEVGGQGAQQCPIPILPPVPVSKTLTPTNKSWEGRASASRPC
jgi:hypothetical protein